MAKLTLSDVANLSNETTAVTTINNNSAATEAALENTLSRDGTSPNQMGANLDMNSHRILNLLDASTEQEPVTLAQFHGFQEATLGDIQATLDFVFGSTPDFFMVRGATTWGSRAIIGTDLPTPTTTSLGGIFANPGTTGQVFGGLDETGTLTPATQINLTSTSSIALTIGPNGFTNPVFQVVSSATMVNGLAVTGTTGGNGVDFAVISSSASEPLRINAKGPNGGIALNSGQVGQANASISAYTNINILHDVNPTLQFGQAGAAAKITTVGTNTLTFANTAGTGTFLKITPQNAADINYFEFNSNNASNAPIVKINSVSSTDVGMSFMTKGAGSFTWYTASASNPALELIQNASGSTTDRRISFQGGNSGGSTTNPSISLAGTSGGVLSLNNKTAVNASDASAFVISKTVGGTTPAFKVDTSTASAITGVSITSRATGGGVNIDGTGDTNTTVIINGSGSGTLALQNIATGTVLVGAAASGTANLQIAQNTNPRLQFGSTGNVPAFIRTVGSGSLTFQNDSAETILKLAPSAASGITAFCEIGANASTNVTMLGNSTGATGSWLIGAKGVLGEIAFYSNSFGAIQAKILGVSTGGGDGSRFLSFGGATAAGNCSITASAGSIAFGVPILVTGAIGATSQITATNGAAVTAGGSNTTGFKMYTDGLLITGGSGAPTLSAAKGSLYLRTDGSSTTTRAYINTDGGTTWTSITTAA